LKKKNHTYLIVIIASSIFAFNSMYAQHKSLYFDSYSTNDGLSHNSIHSIAQDSKGFIWIGTQSGLNRFDGYDFKIYKKQETKKINGLLSGFVRTLTIDKFDRIWIGTAAGLNCYDIKNDKFYLFQFSENKQNSVFDNFINYVFIDKSGFLWVATHFGLKKSKKDIGNRKLKKGEKLEFTKFYIGEKSNSISNNSVNCIFEDKKNNIWIGTKFGLNTYNKKSKKFSQYFYSEKNMPKQNIINSINQLNDSMLIIGSEAGLLSFNLKTKLFSTYEKHPFFIENKLLTSITKILKDTYSNLWIATKNKGLIFYNSKTKKFKLYKKDNENLNGLFDNSINTLFEDKSSTLFVGLSDKGLNTTKISLNNFELYTHTPNNSSGKNSVCQFYYYDSNTIWISTMVDGLYKFNLNKKKIKHYSLNKITKNGININSLYILPKDDNNLWIGTVNDGLLLFNHKTGKYIQYKKEKNINSISSNTIYSMVNDKSNNLWIATFGGGLNKFNIRLNKFEHFKNDTSNINSISNNYISILGFDKDSILWIGTWGGGLNAFNLKTKKFTCYKHSLEDTNSISSDFCVTIHFDSDGIIWFGTSNGLSKFNKKTGKFKTYTKEDGLPDIYIKSIKTDNNNNLWISHYKGISVLNKKTEKIINYTIKDGLQDNEFNGNASIKLSDGRMIFGGISGFNLFHPDSIKYDEHKSSINITKFKVFYSDVEIGKKYNETILLNKSITYTDTISLNYKNNVISFEFTACDYKNPENIKYAFKLNGFEDNWNYTSSDKRFATYTNLDYGTYTLQIKLTDADGVWNDKIKELVIIVNVPFWLTLWFKVFLIIIPILFIFVFYKIRTKVLKTQKENLEKQVAERTTIIKEQKETIKNKYEEVLFQKKELKEKYEEIVVQEEEIREQAEELRTLSEKLKELNKSLSFKVKERTKDLEIALEKAEDAEKLISSFLSNLSHEIRTPMNAIVGFSQILNSADIEQNERKEFTLIIEKNVDALLKQIDNIMNIAKLHRNQYKIVNNKFNISELFRQIYNDLKSEPKIIKEDINFKLKVGNNERVIVFSDEESYNLIILNLVENAIKYTEKGYVEFGYNVLQSNNEKFIEFFVNDTGIGIDKKDKKTIFKAFSKVEDSKKKLYRGTGLGLALVKSLVDKLSGEIELESKLNEGTKIKVLIPVSYK